MLLFYVEINAHANKSSFYNIDHGKFLSHVIFFVCDTQEYMSANMKAIDRANEGKFVEKKSHKKLFHFFATKRARWRGGNRWRIWSLWWRMKFMMLSSAILTRFSVILVFVPANTLSWIVAEQWIFMFSWMCGRWVLFRLGKKQPHSCQNRNLWNEWMDISVDGFLSQSIIIFSSKVIEIRRWLHIFLLCAKRKKVYGKSFSFFALHGPWIFISASRNSQAFHVWAFLLSGYRAPIFVHIK